MLLHFYKMNGAGNDFVVIDNRDLSTALTKDQIELLCDRHRGIGADGLLAVEPAENGADCGRVTASGSRRAGLTL